LFKSSHAAPSKGDRTREHVLAKALELFRRKGFERTTMRDIAGAAGLSLGAAYHYFGSKEELIGAYYEWIQSEHERLLAEREDPNATLEARVRTALLIKLELLKDDRKLLGALFANLGDPSHPLSLFGKKTARVRERSIALFVRVFDVPTVPEELRAALGHALFLAHLGVFVFFIHDGSRGAQKTRKLAESVVELVARAVPFLAHPLALPARARLLDLLSDLAPTAFERTRAPARAPRRAAKRRVAK
jgi:AcrR family transcriptional regulator